MSRASHEHRDKALQVFLAGWAGSNARKKKAIGMMLSGQHRMRDVVEECGIARSTLQDWWKKFQSDARHSAKVLVASVDGVDGVDGVVGVYGVDGEESKGGEA